MLSCLLSVQQASTVRISDAQRIENNSAKLDGPNGLIAINRQEEGETRTTIFNEWQAADGSGASGRAFHHAADEAAGEIREQAPQIGTGKADANRATPNFGV